jgi:hypothetical protein
MRYVDTGSRDPDQALGTWLGEVIFSSSIEVTALRIQTGFFGSGVLGYFEDLLDDLAVADLPTRFLIGSNDGQTPKGAIDDLLAVAGTPRTNLGIGVVSFVAGYFHSKVVHFEREDGSAAAYVGSANLTPSGVGSLHVEAGMILDTASGDAEAVLDGIAVAVDDWFTQRPDGFYPVATPADLDELMQAKILGSPAPAKPKRKVEAVKGENGQARAGHALRRLVALPAIKTQLPDKPPVAKAAATAGTTEPQIPQEPSPTVQTPANSVAKWSKTLSTSDAQRRAGHQSKLVALTQGHYRNQIDHTVYFRNELFGRETWVEEVTTSKEPLEVAYVPIRTVIEGFDYGTLTFRITHASHRESGTNSPTTEIHLEPIATLFAQQDMTGTKCEIERYSDGSYSLTIS